MTSFRSETLSFSGRPGMRDLPLAWFCASSSTLRSSTAKAWVDHDSRVTRHTGQDDVVQRGSDELDGPVGLVKGDEQVHRADLESVFAPTFVEVSGLTSVSMCSSPSNQRFWLYPCLAASACGTTPGA